jgi:hypothetical protein
MGTLIVKKKMWCFWLLLGVLVPGRGIAAAAAPAWYVGYHVNMPVGWRIAAQKPQDRFYVANDGNGYLVLQEDPWTRTTKEQTKQLRSMVATSGTPQGQVLTYTQRINGVQFQIAQARIKTKKGNLVDDFFALSSLRGITFTWYTEVKRNNAGRPDAELAAAHDSFKSLTFAHSGGASH